MIKSKSLKSKQYDEDGVLVKYEEQEEVTSFKKNAGEGDYIKLYFDEIDMVCKLSAPCVAFFLQLAKRVTYANVMDLENQGGQLVRLDKEVRRNICNVLGVKENALYRYLRELVKWKFIKKIQAGVYQVNPYAIGRGLFEYSNTYKYGGIKNLRERFDQPIYIVMNEQE